MELILITVIFRNLWEHSLLASLAIQATGGRLGARSASSVRLVESAGRQKVRIHAMANRSLTDDDWNVIEDLPAHERYAAVLQLPAPRWTARFAAELESDHDEECLRLM